MAAAVPQLQMLPLHAQSILAPSMDIQRLAAAAQLQQHQLQQQQHVQTAAGSASAAAQASGNNKSRSQEVPACLNCVVQ
jgi:hypothetical protein